MQKLQPCSSSLRLGHSQDGVADRQAVRRMPLHHFARLMIWIMLKRASHLRRAAGYETIMMNCNPETVSTDYDTSSRLYFEPLTVEDVLNVIEEERPDGIIVQFGGQTPLKLAGDLQAALTKFQIPAASGELLLSLPSLAASAIQPHNACIAALPVRASCSNAS